MRWGVDSRPVRLEKVETQGEQLLVSVAVPRQESPLAQRLQRGRVNNIEQAMRDEMLLNLPGRVSVVIVDSAGHTHHGSMTNLEPSTDGVEMMTHMFGIPTLPEGVEVQSVRCLVTTCLRYPELMKVRFEGVPLRGEE